MQIFYVYLIKKFNKINIKLIYYNILRVVYYNLFNIDYNMNNKSSICLNMIVKNEKHIIKETLDNLTKYINFSYWVISDTGSTDGTQEFIKEYFMEKNIPGELFQDKWQDFAYNRNRAIEHAFNKSDYLFFFDADDLIHGDFKLPNTLNKDAYQFKFGENFSYDRICLINNREKIGKYVGVLHELFNISKPYCSIEKIEGNYFFESRHLGDRSKNPEKYKKDGETLELAFNNENIDLGLKYRYAYYCGQSYQDAGIPEKSIEWYKKFLDLPADNQYKYCACINLGHNYKNINNNEESLYYYGLSYKYDNTRIEGITFLMDYYYCKDLHYIVNALWNKFKDYKVLNPDDKIFLNSSRYESFEWYNIVSGYYSDDYEGAYSSCKRSVINNYNIPNVLQNLIFYKQQYDNDNDNNVKRFLFDYIKNNNNIDNFNRYSEFIKSYSIEKYDLLYNYFNSNNIDKSLSYKSSNKILIYTGYTNFLWNDSTLIHSSLGGSEKAVIYLSRYLPKNYEIYIAGDQLEEQFDNIKYVNHSNLQKLLNDNSFHTIIVSRYVSFFEEFKNIKCSQLVLSAHDTYFLGNNNEIIKKYNKYIDAVICLTEWHKNIFIEKYHYLKDKFRVINNGINIIDFNNENISLDIKVKNKFVWSSRPERGLNILLDLWPKILEKMPDATLDICSYDNFTQETMYIKNIIDNNPNITYHGKLNTKELYKLINSADYWLYTCTWPETSCITAMEMLMCEVVCLYYPVAGLNNTIGDYGIKVEKGNEIETILNLSIERKTRLRKKGKEYALSCSWENRAEEWSSLLGLNQKKWIFYCPPYFEIKMIEQYIDNLNNIYPDYYIYLTNDKNKILREKPQKITFVNEVFDNNILSELPNTEFSFLNTEPLNIPVRLGNAINILKSYPNFEYYDYSKSNLKILEENGFNIQDKIYLSYKCSDNELKRLTDLNKITKKEFDFGILKSSGGDVTDRRLKIIDFLKENNFTVNIIEGWDQDRDQELAKCKIILNIHGFYQIVSNIFEHIRCDRLLDAGFTILSEISYKLDEKFVNKYPNLKQIEYSDFLNIDVINSMLAKKNICFIHSCHLKDKGLKRLEYLIEKIKDSELIHYLETIHINNIGIPIQENIYGDKFKICNYSDNPALYEIPTINKIHQFSKKNIDYNILYLHTKGINYDNDDQKINDWIDMMLYFLVEKFEFCIKKIQQGIQSIGCNYYNEEMKIRNPKHFSGNFWWADSQYISKLSYLIEKTENVINTDAEFWLCQNEPSIYELHNSKINHYLDVYPSTNYQSHSIIINKLTNDYSSAWLGHMKFAHWLSKLLNPSVIVDLGVDYGHSTFSFASANKGIVYGIDSFDGDIQSDFKNTFDIVNTLNDEFNNKNYLNNNIKFIKGYFNDVYDYFNETIDILHIDGVHTIEAVSNDYNKWITKTSENAVILFHDVVSYPDSVGKVFNDIQYPKFYFTHSAGLGVVCKNIETLNNIFSNINLPNKECIIHNNPIKIFIIHYKKLTDRKKFILKQFEKYNLINYEFIEIDRDELDNYDTTIFNKNFGNALTAISLSHFYAYKKISEYYDRALIFEDDIILSDNFMIELTKYMNDLPNDFDILSIGDGSQSHVNNYEIVPNKNIYKQDLEKTQQFIRCTDSYIVSKKCAKFLCEYINNSAKNINEAIDNWLNNIAVENNFIVYWAEPTIVTQGSLNGLFDRSWCEQKQLFNSFIDFDKNLTKLSNSEFLENLYSSNYNILDNLKFYFGINNKQIDITNIVIEKCMNNNKITIPQGCNERSNIFSDPLFGVVKNIYIINNNNYCVSVDKEYIYIDLNEPNNSYISESFNPEVLTCYMAPNKKERLGKDYDGGYVICDIPDISYNLLLSCGISDDISFEEQFCDKFKYCPCYAYDGTIQDIDINNNNITFIKKNINNFNDDNNTNLHEVIEKYDNIFLKMDIEGWEIPWIETLNKKQINKFSQIVIEFHFPFSGKEVLAFNKLNKNHILIHFHANNCCGVRLHKGVEIPNVFECTYIHKKYYNTTAKLNTISIPSKLDMRNVINNKEINIDYKPFVFNFNEIKIIDCFTFYNEIDLLTYRLNILNDFVDYFILVEATHTHVGKKKPLFYQENKYLFEKFNDKIIHIIVDDFPHKFPNINIKEKEQWINEKFQRNCISRGLDKLSLQNNDVITITDLDEIPNPKILEQIKNNKIIVDINIIEMDFYYYNLNSKMDHQWHHSKILSYKKYKEVNIFNITCDNIRFYSCPIIKNAGWHLSYFGNEKFIKNKLENFGHQEYNKLEFTDEKLIKERINNGNDLFDRPINIINIPIEDNQNLPPDYDIYLTNFYKTKLVNNIEISLHKSDLYQSKITPDIINMEGMSGKKTRHFYNNICSMDDSRYLEIGTWKGSSICAAMCGNNMKCLCIDNWSEFGGPKEEFLKNFNLYKGNNKATFIESNCWDVNLNNIDKFNIYMYDGNHTEESHFKAINYYLSCLDNEFIYLVDDWNHDPVRYGTMCSIKDNNLKIIYKKEIFTDCNPGIQKSYNDWHNGICIFVLKK